MKKILYVFVLGLFIISSSVIAQTQINKYCFNNTLIKMVKAPDGGMLVCGNFTNVAEYCGSAVKFNSGNTADFNVNDAKIEGAVTVIVSISAGGWYIGGDFTSVNGISRAHLARINSDGTLNEFNPSLNCTSVNSLTIDSADRLYVGGVFSGSNGIICLNPDTTLTNFHPVFNGAVNVMTFDASGNLFVGGAFTSPRSSLAKFNTDGTLNAFNPIFNGAVLSIKFNSTGDFFVGGVFTIIDSNNRSRLAKFNANTTLVAFNPTFNGIVRAIAIDASDNLYVGGDFTWINNAEFSYLVKFNSLGVLGVIYPTLIPNGAVLALGIDNSGALYCGGRFTVASEARNYFAKFESNGQPTTFDASMNGVVNTIAINPSGIVYIGGTFTGVKAQARKALAKFNANGSLNPFNANLNYTTTGTPSVQSMAVDGLGNLYIAGGFNRVGNITRSGFAKFNANLSLNNFNPNTTGFPFINAVATDSANNFYVAGGNYVFAKYSANGTLLFHPQFVDTAGVYAIVVDGQDNVFIGGIFSNIMGQTRNNFAKFTANATLDTLNPVFNATTYCLELDSSGAIYVGGIFTSVNSTPRSYLAKINSDGSLNSFNPIINTGGYIRAITPGIAGNLFIGGNFTSINGIQRDGFAKFNPDGTLNSFYQHGAGKGGGVYGILMNGSTLHVGGRHQEYNVYENGDSTCDLTLSNPIPASRCGTGSVTLSVTPSSGAVNWYDAPINGNLVGTGTTFTTPTISSTKTYYAQAVDGACFSFSRTEVVATVLPTQGCSTVVNLRLFIQGYYNDVTHQMFPAKFNQSVAGATNEVTTLTVQLLDQHSLAVVATTTAELKQHGVAVCTFPTAINGTFFLKISTWNTIQTYSKLPVVVGPIPLSYDFSDAASKAAGDNMKLLETGLYGIYSGNFIVLGVQDPNIDNEDFSKWEADYNDGLFNYIATDLNGDANPDNADYSIFESNYNDGIYEVLPDPIP